MDSSGILPLVASMMILIGNSRAHSGGSNNKRCVTNRKVKLNRTHPFYEDEREMGEWDLHDGSSKQNEIFS